MSKLEKITLLSVYLTQDQLDRLTRCYPDGYSAKEYDNVLRLITSTLIKNRDAVVETKTLVSSQNNLVEQLEAKDSELVSLKREVERLNTRITNMTTPVTVEQEEINDQLNLLNALVRAGVDNWEGYDIAIDLLKGDE